jgi:hypothetical protein
VIAGNILKQKAKPSGLAFCVLGWNRKFLPVQWPALLSAWSTGYGAHMTVALSEEPLPNTAEAFEHTG